MPPASPRSERTFALLLTALFAVLVTLSIGAHEPWRDEVHPWLVARDSTGLLSVVHNIRYDGHPALWYLVLVPFTRLGGIALMSVVNGALVTLAVLLFVRFAPLSRTARVLFVLGYLPLYEYGTIARNYGIGVLLLFTFAALFPLRRRWPILLAVALALAASTSAHAAVVSGGALLLLAVDWLTSKPGARASLAAIVPALLVGAAGLVASVLQVIPPPDSAIGEIWTQRPPLERLGLAASSLVHGFAPVPFPRPLEETALHLLQVPQVVCGAVVMVVFVTIALLTLVRRPVALCIGLVPVLVLLVAFYARYYGGPRHAGFMWAAVLMGLWVAPQLDERAPRSAWLARASTKAEAWLPRVVIATFAFHVVGAVIAVSADVRWVFSAAPKTAALIRAKGLERLPLVAAPDWSALNVVGHLDAPRAYYANVERWGSFMIQDSHHAGGQWAPAPADEVVFEDARKIGAEGAGSDVLVVINREAAPAYVAAHGITFVGHERADFYPDESFWVYVVPGPRR